MTAFDVVVSLAMLAGILAFTFHLGYVNGQLDAEAKQKAAQR